MDIVLEFVDRLVFDPIYATLFPTAGLALGANAYKGLLANRTVSSFAEHPTAAALYNNFQYTPASKYIQLGPSEYAYLTTVSRDDPIRQFISLYLIVW
jgi:lathosterol oxidase